MWESGIEVPAAVGIVGGRYPSAGRFFNENNALLGMFGLKFLL